MSARSASSSSLSSASEILEVSRTSGDENEKSKLTYPIINVKGGDPKKKPYDVKFSKYNPKINPNIKYSSKQAYRQYKSKVEPNLNKNIMIEEEDDLVKKIKKAFGIKPENTNFTDVESAPFESTYAKFPENKLFNETVPSISEMEIDDELKILGAISEFNLSEEEKLKFENDMEAFLQEGMTTRQIKTLMSKALDKIFKERGNEHGKFQKNDLPKLKEIGQMDLSKANSIYDSLTDDEKRKMSFQVRYKEEYPINFINAVKRTLIYRFVNEKLISDSSKPEKEALLGQKLDDGPVASRLKSKVANLQIQPPEPQFSTIPPPTPPRRDITPKAKAAASPSASEISQESTVGGEITSQNIVMSSARRSIGRPATRPETIAKQIVEDLIHTLELEELIQKNK